LEAGLDLEWLVVAQGAPEEAFNLAGRAARAGAEVCLLDAEVIERLAPTRTSQGLLGVARMPSTDLQHVLQGNPVVILEGIQDPGNTGTLLRTARAAGAGGAVLVGGADPFNSRAVRAASGATFRLPLVRLNPEQAPMLLQALDQAGFGLACAEAHDGQDLYQAPFPTRMALVLGGEVRGGLGSLPPCRSRAMDHPSGRGLRVAQRGGGGGRHPLRGPTPSSPGGWEGRARGLRFAKLAGKAVLIVNQMFPALHAWYVCAILRTWSDSVLEAIPAPKQGGWLRGQAAS